MKTPRIQARFLRSFVSTRPGPDRASEAVPRAAHPDRRLVKGETALAADTALRLSKLCGNTAEYRMNLYDTRDPARTRETTRARRSFPLKQSDAICLPRRRTHREQVCATVTGEFRCPS